MREYISFKMQDAFGKLYSENTTLEEISQFTKDYDEARYALGLIDECPPLSLLAKGRKVIFSKGFIIIPYFSIDFFYIICYNIYRK